MGSAGGFGVWLLAELGRRDLSRRGFAARLGVAHGTVARWIAGDDVPSSAHVNAIAHVLGVRPALVLSKLPGGEELDDDAAFYASLPRDLTDEERRGIVAYIRALRSGS